MHYTISLLDVTDKDGVLPCPQCGAPLSPNDESEDNYEIVDTEVKENELISMTLKCKKCKDEIKLVGFQGIKLESSLR